MEKTIDYPQPEDFSFEEKELFKLGVKRYKYLKKHYKDFTLDYFSSFILFYTLQYKRKTIKHLEEYHKVLSKYAKCKIQNFDEALTMFTTIKDELSKICELDEIVLTTKFVHTLFNDFPILDSRIMTYFKVSDKDKKNISQVILNIHNWYSEYTKTKEGRKNIDNFRSAYECEDISDAKVIDFLIWGKKQS